MFTALPLTTTNLFCSSHDFFSAFRFTRAYKHTVMLSSLAYVLHLYAFLYAHTPTLTKMRPEKAASFRAVVRTISRQSGWCRLQAVLCTHVYIHVTISHICRRTKQVSCRITVALKVVLGPFGVFSIIHYIVSRYII